MLCNETFNFKGFNDRYYCQNDEFHLNKLG